MKRFSFWIITLIFTFLIGIGAFLTWFYYKQQIVEVEPVPLIENNCVNSKSFPGLSKKISEIQKGESGYFPKYTWSGSNIDDDYEDYRASQYLKSFGEKPLLNTTDNREVYRFLWIRSFDHPIFVRIEKTNNSIQLFSKELDGTGQGNSKKVLRKEHKILNEQQWCSLLTLLEQSEYWKTPTDYSMGRDGSNWILEGLKDGRYHVVNIWSPKNAEYREACIYLLKLSGFDTDYYTD